MGTSWLLMTSLIVTGILPGTGVRDSHGVRMRASDIQCDQAYMGRVGHGVIHSYNYPFAYRHNLTCTHRIYLNNQPGQSSSTICFTFHRFLLETSTPYCSFDSLKIDNIKYCGLGLWQYGGMDTESSDANVWNTDFCWTAKNSHFDIVFHTDTNVNAAGYYTTFEVHDGAHPDGAVDPQYIGSAPCEASDWTCFNRKCISKTSLCDGQDHCGDGSDESYAHARCGEQNVLACDFSGDGTLSDGYCGFTHDGWYRTDERHSPYGPRGDHTNGTHGFYVYTDVNESSSFLLSPELSLRRNQTFCLTFWYYVYGRPAAAILRVYVSRDQAYSRPEWSRRQSQENEWLKGEVVVNTNHPLQVIFAAELDNSFSGVSLDDISVMEGTCSGNDISCNFESGVCSWQTTGSVAHQGGDLYGDLNWRVHNRLLAPIGPFRDHSSTDGGGYYLYVNSSGKPQDSRALLMSQAVSAYPGDKRCLRFWYHMEGITMTCCQLRIKVHNLDGSLSDAVWTQAGDVRNAWKSAHVNVDTTGPFRIVVEGIVSHSSRGEIAVDEVILDQGECRATGSTTCEAGQYMCVNGRCINATLKCDNTPDCEDASDENEHAGCPPPTPRTDGPCPTTHYRCLTGACIPTNWMCDSFNDCIDNSDEDHNAGCDGYTQAHTEPPTCTSQQFTCNSGYCVALEDKCNGLNNCEDHSDEADCVVTTTLGVAARTCGLHHFECVVDGGLCIRDTLKCDGKPDCSDGSDESPCIDLSEDGSFNPGIIAAMVVGGILVVLLILLIPVLMRRRKKHSRQPRRPRDIQAISFRDPVTQPVPPERRFNIMETLQQQQMQTIQSPTQYATDRGENRAYTPERGQSSASNSDGLSYPHDDEPPPPYDAVMKDPPEEGQDLDMMAPSRGSVRGGTSTFTGQAGSRPGSARRSGRPRSRSRSRSREHSRSPQRDPARSSVRASARRSNPPGMVTSSSAQDMQRPPTSTSMPQDLRDAPRGPTNYRDIPLPDPPRDSTLRSHPYGSGIRTMPQRIRLGTQALNRGNRPRHYYMDQGQVQSALNRPSSTLSRPSTFYNDGQSISSGASDHIYETLDNTLPRPERGYTMPQSPSFPPSPGAVTETMLNSPPSNFSPGSPAYPAPQPGMPRNTSRDALLSSQNLYHPNAHPQHSSTSQRPPLPASMHQQIPHSSYGNRSPRDQLPDTPTRGRSRLTPTGVLYLAGPGGGGDFAPSSAGTREGYPPYNADSRENSIDSEPCHPRVGSNVSYGSYDNRSSVALLDNQSQTDETLHPTCV